MPRFLRLAGVLAVAGFATMLFGGNMHHGCWQTRIPAKARNRPNPLASDPGAVRAGAKLFEQHCAQCHGSTAEGKKGPNLRSHHIAQATPGEIEWLLTNGILEHGMPSWSRLPEPQRWQLVSYLKSLQQGHPEGIGETELRH